MKFEGATKLAVLFAAGCAATSGASAEPARTETCRKGEDIRTIEILVPGVVGAACDVRSIRDGGAQVTTPYNANSDQNFCRARAAELAAALIADGYQCSTAPSETIEAALAGGSAPLAAADQPLDAQLRARQGAGNEQPERLDQPSAVAATATSAPKAAGAETVIAEPVHLAAGARPIEFQAPPPQASKGPGRLVGAQPSIEDIIDIATSAPSTVKAEATTPTAASGVLPARTPEEIIRGVLAAGAAAWNEGDLDAFMGAYAEAGDVTLTDNAEIVKGRAQIRRRFREHIEMAGEMGRLSYGPFKVTLTAADAASVAGPFSIARADADVGGVVSLVMKEIDGRWRIVEETRTAEAAPTE